jgi:hypothetical protein
VLALVVGVLADLVGLAHTHLDASHAYEAAWSESR